MQKCENALITVICIKLQMLSIFRSNATRRKYVLQWQRIHVFLISNSKKRRKKEQDLEERHVHVSLRSHFFHLFQRSIAPSSYIVVCLSRRMHRIITKLLTIPASGPPAFSIRFVSIAWSEESKMAVSDRGTVSRQRSADEDEGEEKEEDRLSVE